MKLSQLKNNIGQVSKMIFGDKRLVLKNLEGIDEFFLKEKFWAERPHGLSAMMRIKNDEKWIFFAVTSILEYVDEIVIVLQNCTDKTEQILNSIKSPKIKIYHYPFDSFPSGPFHEKFINGSVFNRAYYYNYALSKTSFSYVWKWDGDHAAIEFRIKELRDIIDSNKFDIIHCKGYDIFGSDLKYLCKDPFTSNEPCIFKVFRNTFYFSGNICEQFSYPLLRSFRKLKILNYSEPIFIHFKYIDGDASIGKGWVENWREDPYFISIADRKSRGQLYTDEYPEVLKKYYFNGIHNHSQL